MRPLVRRRSLDIVGGVSRTDDLRQTLHRLHQEIEAAPAGDPEVRALLRQSLREIQDKLEEREGALVSPTLAGAETLDTLRARARQFEVDHPELATEILSVVDALSRMGI
jgi:hypothetical protein